MMEFVLRNQKLLTIQFITFSVLFGSVIVTSAIVYTQTTAASMFEQEKKVNTKESITKTFATMKSRTVE